ncbi:hypothetical protein MYX77_02525 [Acidobacteriia bacterium AH_259_A11_L15]|nr:hypothetical protein [Acidobacteriia bacterium AH_259_A11_L15]
MAVRAEEIEAKAKLAAQRVFGHLEGERLIPRFIDSYIMGFDRPTLKNPPDQFRERSNQLGRAALLLLGRLTAEKCSGQFTRFRLGPLKIADGDARRRFQGKFWQSVAAELKISPEAGAELAREAEDYSDPARRATLFRERIAPLLDPAPQMKDKAEHAGQKFYEALEKVAAQVAARVSTQSS